MEYFLNATCNIRTSQRRYGTTTLYMNAQPFYLVLKCHISYTFQISDCTYKTKKIWKIRNKKNETEKNSFYTFKSIQNIQFRVYNYNEG